MNGYLKLLSGAAIAAMIIVIHVIGPVACHGHGGGVTTPRRLILVPTQELSQVQGLTLLLSSFLA